MPSASNIVLADAQATPVNRTFIPMGRDKNGVFWFEDQSPTSAIGYWKISVELKKPSPAAAGMSSNGRSFRVAIGLHEPVLETVSNSTVSGIAPAPTIAYTPRVVTEFILPERAVLLDRKNLRKMVANLVADANIVAVVENLQYLS